MKKMSFNEMSKVNGGFAWWAAALGWWIGRSWVCGSKGFGKC